jgi:hypothetical protein
MGHSQLYAHLFQIGLSESSECNCGHGIEGMWHYFFLCPHHAIHRDVLHRKVSTYATFSLKTVVFSASGCNWNNNKAIFLSVQEYILKTQDSNPVVLQKFNCWKMNIISQTISLLNSWILHQELFIVGQLLVNIEPVYLSYDYCGVSLKLVWLDAVLLTVWPNPNIHW